MKQDHRTLRNSGQLTDQPEFPFPGRTTDASYGTAENKTPPVPDEIFQPMLVAALYLVQALAPPLGQAPTHRPQGDAAQDTH